MISLKLVLLFLALVGAISLSGCATTTNLQKNCKQVGGEYYECDHYPWFTRSCERFQ